MAGLTCWLESSLKRVYPTSPAGERRALYMVAARNESLSLQVCAKNNTTQSVTVRVAAYGPEDIGTRIRRVGLVALKHHTTDCEAQDLEGIGAVPGLVPDPLFHEDSFLLGPFESCSFWMNIDIPAETDPGKKGIRVRVYNGEEPEAELFAAVSVKNLVVKRRQNFPVTHWYYADALCDYYKVEPYSEEFWPINEKYISDMVNHGNDCVYVPVFTPPTDGVKRPHQLLKVTTPSEGKYEFDFTDVERWTSQALACGANYFEWTHLFWQWGVKTALRIYRDNSEPESLIFPADTGATSDVYRNFLAQFLPAFKAFLDKHGYMEKSFFHLSDEPSDEHLENYRAAREMLRELAPWMKVMDALSHVEFAKEGLTDIPIPVLSTAKDFAAAGIPAWTYYCCGPKGAYTNRLLDTPLAKIRMQGWLFYKLKAQGFLHWGYNYWYKSQTQDMIDPYTEASGGQWPGWGAGDPFEVYPGPDGPIDSIRWEVFSDSLRDYALLQTLNTDPNDPMLARLLDYDDFPKDIHFVPAMRELLLTGS